CAAAAAILPRAPGIGIDGVALHTHGKRQLQHLHRRVHGVRYAGGDNVDAVLVGPSPKPALDRLIGYVAPPRPRIDAAQGENGGGSLAAGHHLLWPDAGQGSHRHVGHAVGDLVVGIDHGRGELCVHHGALLRRHLDRSPATGVGRDQTVGIDSSLERTEDARGGYRQRRVDRPLHRSITACEIDAHAVAFLRHAHAYPELRVPPVRIVGDAIAIAEILEGTLPAPQTRPTPPPPPP